MAPHGVYRCAGDDALDCRGLPARRGTGGRCAQFVAGLPADAHLAERFRPTRSHRCRYFGLDGTTYKKQQPPTACRTPAYQPAPVNITPDMTADPQVQARGFFVPLELGPHAHAGQSREDGRPSAATIGRPAPRLGADNRAVLHHWLGYDDDPHCRAGRRRRPCGQTAQMR